MRPRSEYSLKEKKDLKSVIVVCNRRAKVIKTMYYRTIGIAQIHVPCTAT